MKLLDLYQCFAGTKSDFTKPFQENEALFSQAKSFWSHLEGSMIFVIAIFIVLGISLAYTYYKPYNERPGRHYKPSHWLGFLAFTFFATLFITWGFEYIAVKPVLKGAGMLEFKIAILNAIYSSALYFAVSFIWCNWGTTNAYKYFKI